MDMEDCIVYIVFQLRTTGFEVKFTWPNLLYISWKHHEAAYLQSQNPIVQAMVRESKVSAPTPRVQAELPLPKGGSQKKKAIAFPSAKPTVSFNDEISLLTSMPPPSAGAEFGRGPSAGAEFGRGPSAGAEFGLGPMDPAKLPPRRATSEYQPPDAFIRTMERPGPDRPKSVLSDLWG